MRTIALAVLAAVAGTAGAQERLTITDVSPAQPRAGQEVTVAVTGNGPVEVCLAPLGAPGRCAAAAPGQDGAHRAAFSGVHAGRWTVVAGAGAERVERDLVVRARGRRLVVLAVGDSLVRPVAFGLADLLRRRADVVLRRDVQPGAGISKPCCLDWVEHARALADRWHPDVVLVFLGGNEGYSFADVPCCGDPWVARYAERQRALMRAFARDGRARVLWSTMPAPAPSLRDHRTLWAAENRALALATAEDDAGVFDVGALVSPGFRFRRTMRRGGERVVVRRGDGIHLSRAGGRIAAAAFLRRLRADGIGVARAPRG